MSRAARSLITVLCASAPVAYGYNVYTQKRQTLTKVHAAAKPMRVPDLYLQGTWYNELGSTLNMDQGEDGHLVGKFQTGVESTKGAAGPQPRRLYGNASLNGEKNPTFGFSVVYRGSTASWAGQYYNENGNEMLLTTWILRSAKDLNENWESNMIGQDKFTRFRQV